MRHIALFAALTGLAACAATPAPAPGARSQPGYVLLPAESNGHSLSGLNIRPDATLESRQPAGNITLRTSDRFRPYGTSFALVITNLTNSPQEFGPQNVIASASGRPLAVYGADALGERMRGGARAYALATERGRPGRERTLEEATEQAGRERRFNMYGGCPAGEGRCLLESSDVGASFRAGERDRELDLQSAEEVARRLQRDMADLNVALAQGTVPPGAMAGGVLVIERPRAGDMVELVVTFAGQPHTFKFQVRDHPET